MALRTTISTDELWLKNEATKATQTTSKAAAEAEKKPAPASKTEG